MSNDISFINEEYKLNTRVAVVIENDGRYLLENLDGYDYYNLPGGRVKLGETSNIALIRELKEELDLDISKCSPRLIVIAENLFYHNNFNYHEFDYVYYLKLDDSYKITKLAKIDGIDNSRQHLYWIDKDKIRELKCLPSFIYDIDPSELKHVIINTL
jgi:8-oxo-dGTP pyrophosphatase MutT (NUDIX family)